MARDSIRFVPLFMPPAADRQSEWNPSIDVYRTRDGWLVKLDLAGVRPEDVQISLSGHSLVVRGSRRDCVREEGATHYRMEIAYSHFERRVELPGAAGSCALDMEFRDGMLFVRVRPENPARE